MAEGAQGPRTYRFSAERIRETRNREPGGVLWAVYRQNLDGIQPRYYFSNAPEDTPPGDPGPRGRVTVAY